MAHTPGPWEARPNDGQIILNGSNAYDIQEIYNNQGGFNPDDIRLMAAAPELLLLVKRLREVFEPLSDGDWRHLDATYVDELIESDGLEACARAIAKAEGRE